MEDVAEAVGMSPTEAAAASIRLANLHMARALDIVSLERGEDPRRFSLMTFGGAGPMHAAELAEQIQSNTVIVPPHPGLFSALGMMMTDMKYSYVKGVLKRLDDVPDKFLEEAWQSMTEEAMSNINLTTEQSGLKISEIRSVDMRYAGQGFELEIQVPSHFHRLKLRELFEERHEAVYGYRHTGEALEITAIRLTLKIPLAKPSLIDTEGHAIEKRTEKQREVWFSDRWYDTPVMWRDNLFSSQLVDGPAIIEEHDSTTVVPPGWQCSKEQHGCLLMERQR
jgi:N-methylhydantoinase A